MADSRFERAKEVENQEVVHKRALEIRNQRAHRDGRDERQIEDAWALQR